ncbi:MAG: metallophosphoesterase [Nitrospirae bacterium]|nr:metallophosphoesterase [Nitrospirota bacterium]
MQIKSNKYFMVQQLFKFIFLILFLLSSTCKAEVSSAKDLNIKLVTVAVYGDTRGNSEIHRKIVNRIIAEKPDAVFFGGDFVLEGKESCVWTEIHDITMPLRKITHYYPIAGNHEGESQYYFDEFKSELGGKLWQSVDVGSAHFVLLDSNLDLKMNSKQYIWLENDLKTAPKDKFLIVMLHHPPFSVAAHGGEFLDFKDALLYLIEKYKVDAVITGHDHNYQSFKKDNIVYLIIGGGGAPLYDKVSENPYLKKFIKVYNYGIMTISQHNLKINVYTDNGEPIDNILITK